MYTSVRNAPETPDGEAAGPSPADPVGSRSRRRGTRSGRSRATATRVSGAVVAVGFVSFFTDASAEMVNAVLPVFLILAVGLTPLQYGVVDGLYQGATVLVRIVGGYLADRWRRPKLICGLGYGLSAVTKLGMLGVGSVASGSLVLSVDRAGKGLRTAPRDAIIAASTDRAGLGRAFGVHRSLDTAGAMLGPLLAFVMLRAVPGSYDSVFVTSFCIGVVGVAVLALFVPNVRWTAEPAHPASLRGVLRLTADRRVRGLMLAAGLLGLVTVSDGFVYLSLQHRLHTATEVFPLFLLASSGVYLLLAIPLGRLADRVGRGRVFLGGHVGLLVLYGLLLASAPAWVTAVGCLALLGGYYAATDGVLSATAAAVLPEAVRGSGLSLVQTALAGGRLLSSLLFGLFWTEFGGQGRALVVFMVALAVTLPVAGWLLRPPRRAWGTAAPGTSAAG